MSDHTARQVDEEIRRIVDEAYARARTTLTEHIDQLHTVAKGLLEYETLSGDEIGRSEEHTSELQSLMRHSYADFCLTNTQKLKQYIIYNIYRRQPNIKI